MWRQATALYSLLHPRALPPRKNPDCAAGLDLFLPSCLEIDSGETVSIDLGLCIMPPSGHRLQLITHPERAESGLLVRGDDDNERIVTAKVHNLSKKRIQLDEGEVIARGHFMKTERRKSGYKREGGRRHPPVELKNSAGLPLAEPLSLGPKETKKIELGARTPLPEWFPREWERFLHTDPEGAPTVEVPNGHLLQLHSILDLIVTSCHHDHETRRLFAVVHNPSSTQSITATQGCRILLATLAKHANHADLRRIKRCDQTKNSTTSAAASEACSSPS